MALAKTINISDFRKELKKIGPEWKKEVIDATYSGVLKSQERLNQETPVDTGFLLASWEVEKNPLEPEPSVILGNTAPYATVVLESGAKPHTPPPDAIIEWAARKLKKPREHPLVKSLAWGTIKKIQRKGIEAKFIFSKAIDEYVLPNILEEVDKVLNSQ